MVLQIEASMNNTLKHVVLGIVAELCLLVFVIPPMVVLLFYHLKIFQQCLKWCKLDRPGLHALVDAYQGCFKNSATDDVARQGTLGSIFCSDLLPCNYCATIEHLRNV